MAAKIVKAMVRAGDLALIIEEPRASSITSLRQIAAGLNATGIEMVRGSEWSAGQVQRVLERA